ncbi:MAG: putative phage abortive infection protein [Mesorhizobium sp.]|uniref:putative phage abortive infection protein n=1 Tax=Mesorhizobium sp. TaxID=1871066 RepID=UPI001AC9B769|nr:putative phage abortive infection protein [Mesorhizobium sp.]MBN9219299.1 putative phage abortive infection protein [Mesorhizobium sp.]
MADIPYRFILAVAAIIVVGAARIDGRWWLRGLFYRMVDPEAKDMRAAPFGLLVLAILLTIAMSVLAFSAWFFNGAEIQDVGAFLDGTLTPIFTFITVIGLLLTIVIQQFELRLTRDEFARSANALETQIQSTDRQNFESTFFQMLNLHNSIVNAMDLRNKEGGQTSTGRDCFKTFFVYFERMYHNNMEPNDGDKISSAYKEFMDSYKQDIGHYFRYLYNVVRFVDESPVVDKQRYMRLLRAQLSDYELLLMFYSCQTPIGKRFGQYVVRYALLDNVPRDKLLVIFHENLLPAAAALDKDDFTSEGT